MSKHLLSRAEINAMEEKRVQHQFNDNAVRHTRTLSSATGMERIGIHEIRLEPGRDSTTHHFHDCDEEFIYVLASMEMIRPGFIDEHASSQWSSGFSPAWKLHSEWTGAPFPRRR